MPPFLNAGVKSFQKPLNFLKQRAYEVRSFGLGGVAKSAPKKVKTLEQL